MSLSLALMAGCANHKHKTPSYDRPFADTDKDPTYHPDPERADLEVHEEQ